MTTFDKTTSITIPFESRTRSVLSLHVQPPGGTLLAVPLRADESLTIGGTWDQFCDAGEPRHVAIPDSTISAAHACIDVDSGGVQLTDLGSRNGTWIGGSKVNSAHLSVGSTVVVGRTLLLMQSLAFEAFRASESESDEAFSGAIGRAPAMRALGKLIKQYAPLRAPAMIMGESGSGKELVARALHSLSHRKDKPFVAVNLGALAANLIEAELFGHEKGAFTSAVGARAGVFEAADGGTLFLDELGELPLDLQAKLLRVLETGEVRRIGARGAKAIDVRVVTASWARLSERVANDTFRADLFHRLAVLMLEVPPLRDRKTDIPLIARAILHRNRDELGDRVLSPAALSRMTEETWPGNIRELRNVLYRAATFCQNNVIEVADVARAFRPTDTHAKLAPGESVIALVESFGSVSAAARAVGVPRETLRDWVRSARGIQKCEPEVREIRHRVRRR